jgi:hypothetical protein
MLPFLILAVAMMGAIVGCKKSEGSAAPNPFGPPPTVSDVLISKVPKHFDCSQDIALCCVDPPTCTCCCVADTVNQRIVDLDLVQVSVKVEDPDGLPNILVALVTFLDPPKSSPSSSSGTSQINLELWDTGTTPIASQVTSDGTFPILSGDATAGDGIYTRYFYLLAKGSGTEDPGTCIQSQETPLQGGTFSIYSSTVPFPATKLVNFDFFVQAVDRSGNIAKSATTTVAIAQSEVTLNQFPRDCGPPTGNGGCLPGTP